MAPSATQPATTHDAAVAALTGVLADTYALAAKTHGAHWNVVGPQFFALHEAFAAQYAALYEAADELAERVRALGRRAPSGLEDLARLSRVRPAAADDGATLVRELASDHRALAAAATAAARAFVAAGDDGSADLLVGRAQEHDKTAWMLAAAAG